MTDKPNTADPQKPRVRWFQFRLRTLLFVVTLVANLFSYVGWQAKIVRGRKAILYFQEVSARYVLADDHEIPAVRRWLGDHAVGFLWTPHDNLPDAALDDLRREFPEAVIAHPGKWYEGITEALRRYPNLHLESGGIIAKQP